MKHISATAWTKLASVRLFLQETCNTSPCLNVDPFLRQPAPLDVWAAGQTYNISWGGGIQYGTVLLQAKLLALSVSAQQLNATTDWDYGSSLGLPLDALSSTGSAVVKLPDAARSALVSLRVSISKLLLGV